MNVLLIVVDTLRADHLGCYGAKRETSPAIDALAAGSIRYERAYTVAPWTMPSVATILTGLYPAQHRVTRPRRRLPEQTATLATVFAEAGYRTAAVVSNRMIGAMRGFDHGFDRFDEDEARGHGYLSTPGVTKKAAALLDTLAAGDRPFFLFVHYFDPHYNYIAHPEYGFAPPRAGRLDGEQDISIVRRMMDTLTGKERRFLLDLYDGEIRFTDDGVGRLLRSLDRSTARDNTLVIFTSDHGEEFLEHGWIGHTRSLYEELMRVPLIIREPGGAPARVVRKPVSLVSLPGTVLHLAGVGEERLDTRISLLPPWNDGAAAPILLDVDFQSVNPRRGAFSPKKKGLIEGEYKLIRDEKEGKRELYDLSTDPLERSDLSGKLPDILERLAARLDSAAAAAGRDTVVVEKNALTDEEKDIFRGLGYIGSH